MAVVIGEKTYEVVNGKYYLVATYGLAAQISGMYPPSDIENKILTKEYVSNTGCQIVSDPVLTYTPTMCVLYRDLEVDEDIMLDGDEYGDDYVEFCYTTTDNNILTPYPYDEEVVEWYIPLVYRTGYRFKDGISINPWYQENAYTKHTDSDGKVWYEGIIETNTREIPSITQSGVFQDCTTLKEITTFVNPTIGENCFKNCENLDTVTILGNDNHYDVIINNNAFMNCTQLKTVIFGSYWYNPMDDKVTIGQNAFYGDVKLRHLQGQDNIKTIGNYAFKDCSELTVLTLLNCDSIGNQAFENCTNITKIIVKGSATFGSNIFSGCTNIEEIIFLGDCSTNSTITNMMTQLDSVAKTTLKVRVPNDYYSNYYNKLSGIETSKEWKTQLSNNKYESYNDIVLCDYDTKGNDGVWDTAVAFGWLKYNIRHLTIYESEIITNFPQIANSRVINDVFDKDDDKHGGENGYSTNQGEHLLSFNQFKWFTGLTSVPYGAFSGCTKLSSVTIPDSVTSIENNAFYDCYDLSSVILNNNLSSIGDEAFYECYALSSINIPNNVTSIGSQTFYTCRSLTSVTIGNSVTSIGDSAFNSCNSLTSVTLNSNTIVNSSSIKDIFGNQVTKYIIGNDVTGIGECAFDSCSSLTSVTIGNSVTSIGSSSFTSCTSLTSVTIPNSVTNIGDNVFEDCTSLSYVTIPNSVTIIGNGVFYGCSSLTSVTIPNSVTNIGENTFEECSGLTSVTIPNSVANIGNGAFEGCSGLLSVNIPSNVINIGFDTFYGCTSVTDVYFNWASEEELQGVIWADANEGNDFAGASSGNTIIHIPSGMTSYYEEWAPAWAGCFEET